MGPTDTDLPPPLKDGRYRLEAVLGEGGMATVYRAFDRRLQVERAVKVLAPAMARSPRIRERFLSEARTMARLAHPHVVGVVEVDEDAGRPFMVMELLTGGTLWGWVVDHGPMPPRLAVDASLAVLDGLSAAHACGVVHRDIKPQNVLLTGDGVAKVTDFGIARVETADHQTRATVVMGTWTCMPPEQRNSARDVDPRADLYAVGAMIYALVTAREPPDLFAADMDASLLAPLPAPLAEVVRQATRYHREDRPASADAMAEALRAARAALPDSPPRGRPVGTRPRRPVASLPPLGEDLSAASSSDRSSSDRVPLHTIRPGRRGGAAALSPVAVPGAPPAPRARLGLPTDPQVRSTNAPPAGGALYELDSPEGACAAGPGLAGALGLAVVFLVAVLGVVVVVADGQGSGAEPRGGETASVPRGAAPAASASPAAESPAPSASDPAGPPH